jgi:hypothetical protein
MISAKPLMDLSVDYWKSRAFLAAVELGVFRHLGSDGMSEPDLAKELNIDSRRLKPLIGVLKSLDLVEFREETQDLLMTPVSQMFLSPDSPACMEGSFMYAREMFPLWDHLEDRLTQAQPVGLTPTKKDTPTFLMGMHHRAIMMSRMVMPLLHIGEHSKVLDIAAGAGSWSWILKQKGKGQSYTLLEQPELASDMSAFIQKCGFDHFETLAQDYHHLENNPIYNDVLYFGALHQEPMDTLVSVLATCFSQVAPGGTLWVLDIFATGDDKEDLFSWLFGLNMLLTTDGSVFELAEVEDAIKKLEGVDSHRVHRIPTDLPYHLFEIRKAN